VAVRPEFSNIGIQLIPPTAMVVGGGRDLATKTVGADESTAHVFEYQNRRKTDVYSARWSPAPQLLSGLACVRRREARILASQLLPSGRVEVRAGKHRVRHAWQLLLELRLFSAGGTWLVSIMRLNQSIAGKDNEGKKQKGGRKSRRPFHTPCRSQALGSFSNRASSGGASRKGRPTRNTLKTDDLVRGDSVGKTAQTGIGLSQDTEVSRRSQSSCDGRTRNSSGTIRRVGVTVDVTGAGEPGVHVVSIDQ